MMSQNETTGGLPADASVSMPIILRSIVLGSGERTVTDAAWLLRIGRPALSNVLNGKADLSVELAASIEDVFRHSALALLQYQVARQLKEHRARVGSVVLPTMTLTAFLDAGLPENDK